MPIERCEMPDGNSGYRWGGHGHCYADRAEAEKQAEAAYANGYTGDEMIAFDRSVRSIDKSGHMLIEMANISKANVCPYMGKEIPGWQEMGLIADRIYNLYRDPDALAAGAASFAGKPLMLIHRAQMAADHDRQSVIGAVGDAVFEAPYLRAPLTVWDAEGIEVIESGKQRELSCGYFYRADMTPGVIDGEAYDGRMVEITGNHVALVTTGRAGPDVIIGDELPQEIANMSVPARKASRIAGALTDYLKPRLAADADMSDFDKRLAAILAADEAEEEEVKVSVAEKEAEDEDEDEDDKPKGKDKDDEDEDKREQAMDAAVRARVAVAMDAMKAEHRAIREAERAVFPIVGEIAAAMDSAADVYKLALDHLGIDIKGVHPSAYAALVKMARDKNATPRIAADSASGVASAKKRGIELPKLVRI